MRISEIDYASGIPDLAVSQSIIDQATVLGSVDQQTVYGIDDGQYFIAFLKNQNQVSAYVAISSQAHYGYHDLSRIANISAQAGSITALLVFLHAKWQVLYRIPATEPLTSQGLQWIFNRIKNPRGFELKTSQGGKINVDDLQKEWDQARTWGQAGNTDILITKITYNNQVLETHAGFLQPSWRYIGDTNDV
jgi:hypothetical protein